MNHIIIALGKIKNSPFIRHNAVFLAGSIAVGVLNYAYYPVLSRMLSVENYGEVQTLVSLFLQLCVFLTVLSQVAVNIVANYTDEHKKLQIINELEKLALYASFGLLLVVAACGWLIKDVLNFGSAWPFVFLMLAVVATVPLTFRGAFLRGHKKFGMASIANMIGAGSKVIFSAILVAIGWSINGATCGIILAQLLAFGYAARAAKKVGFFRDSETRQFGRLNWRIVLPELKYGLLVLDGSAAITLLSSIDVFVVKHYFDPQTAGLYAGVSTVARIIFFVTAPIAQVMLSTVKMSQPAKENKSIFIKSLALSMLLGGGVFMVFWIFSQQITSILMGKSFDVYASLLPTLSLAMLVISMLNIVISYGIALRRYSIHGKVILGTSFTIFLLSIHHQDLNAVVYSLLFGSIVMLGLFCADAFIKDRIPRFKRGKHGETAIT